MTKDKESRQRAAEMRAMYHRWLENLAQLPCTCAGAVNCDPCKARAVLKDMGELEAARRRRPLKRRKRKEEP